jgi:exopolysaccharide biosynthesis polyprenyl glycosylphosphotransferase
VRTVIVGSSASLSALREELALHRTGRYTLVGCLSDDPAERHSGSSLGALNELRSVLVEHDVELVLVSSDVSRRSVFDEIVHSCSDLDVRICDLWDFYERIFRYTPGAEIDSTWFESVLHPRYRAGSAFVKHVFDVTVALTVAVMSLPLLGVLAVLIRRDGGPALFRQIRIGKDGRPYTMYKLRTMTPRPPEEVSPWSIAEDPRATKIGRYLRRLHLDELPQVWNILRGEMSVVGPRPEQPAFVDLLEREFPYYRWRHAVRPGLAGWAQARCGYAGSNAGVAWKLSHDLYYLKHRSLWFDIRILMSSIWHAVTGDHFKEPRLTRVVHGTGRHERACVLLAGPDGQVVSTEDVFWSKSVTGVPDKEPLVLTAQDFKVDLSAAVLARLGRPDRPASAPLWRFPPPAEVESLATGEFEGFSLDGAGFDELRGAAHTLGPRTARPGRL